MAGSSVPHSSKTFAENESEEVTGDEMTMVDFLEEEERIEENVRAVLGASDDHNCTYDSGYLKRQALYSCLTCIPANSKEEPAGICLACSFNCHDGHELVELYTKRNFRCDCGNKRFPKVDCNLNKDKDNLNTLNKYNQNFFGKYCTCHRPYPDPELDAEEMIQCVICEDWYHFKHIGAGKVPTGYDEMICRDCVDEHTFVRHYAKSCASGDEEPEADNEPPAVVEPAVVEPAVVKPAVVEPVVVEPKKRRDKQKTGKAKQVCLLTTLDMIEARTMFMTNKWRDTLCRCAMCMTMYKEQDLMFLLDAEDRVLAYEDKGLMPNGKPAATQYEKGLEALATLGRSNIIEAVEGYNTMKEELKVYLKTFADNKQVVREEDIRDFFAAMQARKKPRLELPFFCR